MFDRWHKDPVPILSENQKKVPKFGGEYDIVDEVIFENIMNKKGYLVQSIDIAIVCSHMIR